MSSVLPRRLPASGVVLVAALAMVAGQLVGPARAAAAGSCTTSAPGSAYSVTVCLTTPDGTLSGEAPLSATVAIAPAAGITAPAVEKVVFSYREEYLLSDHDPANGMTYAMTWRTTRIADGTGVLEAKARLADDFVARTAVAVTLANG
ncbi:MAG: hypothetical protein ACRDWY_16835, partial [Actinomycetes bacterium]